MKIKGLIDCASPFLLPLMLVVFTVVITWHQANLATQQRHQDKQVAQEQREQDLRIAKAQREEDALRRLQDLSIAKAQREEDILRRLQDFNGTQVQRDSDFIIAQLQRDLDEKLSTLQRAHEFVIEAKRYEQELGKYRHSLLVAYMNEIEAMIVKYNGTINSNAQMAYLVRGKTLALIRQLDTGLKAHLVRFLYDVGQLTNGQQPLDLTDAELDGIDMSSTTSHILPMQGLTLANAYLTNALFVQRDLTNGNFSGARLTGAQFTNSIINHVDFSGATLVNASFIDAILVNASFVDSNANSTKFDRVNATDGNFSRAALQSSSFVQSSLHGVNFIKANLSAANFSLSDLNSIQFQYASIQRADFNMVKGKRLQFSYANLNRASLQHSQLVFSNFTYVDAIETNFAFSNMFGANFNKALAHRSNFSNAILNYSIFSNVWMNGCTFVNAILTEARLPFFLGEYSNFSNVIADRSNFTYCECSFTDFSNSVLFDADFRRAEASEINLTRSQARRASFTESYLRHASFAYADVEKAVFTNADLGHTNLMYSNFSTNQLRQAISIFGARLPSSSNSSATREYNLIENGEANCNINVSKHWQVSNGVVGIERHNSTNCYFTSMSNNGSVTMFQEIKVERYIDKVQHSAMGNSPDVVMLSAKVGGGTSVRLVGEPVNVKVIPGVIHIQNGTVKYLWYPKQTRTLRVIVEFGSMNQSAWCDEIDLWILVASLTIDWMP